MAAISWIHLSDWHQQGADFGRKVVRDGLLRDIGARATINPALAEIDIVIFSGDAAYNGQPKEFEAARRDLFDPLLKCLQRGPEALFLVPGNHDLDRNIIDELAPRQLQSPLTDRAGVEKWLTDERLRRRALESFEAYEKFVTGYTGQESPAYASVRRLEVAGRTVALLGVNSAWMCARNKGADGKVSDKGHLVVGEPQFDGGLTTIADAHLRVVVMHHAFEWLAEFDRAPLEERLFGGADIILWGHDHAPKVRVEHRPAGACVVIPGGAAFAGRVADHPRYTNAYNLVTLNPDTGRGVAYLRRWSDQTKAWVADTETTRNTTGHYEFEVAWLANNKIARGRDGATAGEQKREREGIAAAGQRYQDLLLKHCDLVDLVNLPQDRDVVMNRQLALRRLYVPLRAWVEAGADEGINEAACDEIERRRELQRAGRGRPGAARVQDREREPERVAIMTRLAGGRRLVVLGDPGSGKTTLTRWIASALLLRLKDDPAWHTLPDSQSLPADAVLPIVVRCRDLDGNGATDNLASILKHTLRRTELPGADTLAYLQQEIKAERALLIIDGLDELADPGRRARFCDQLETIAGAYPRLPIIATSRIVGYREMGHRLGRGFEHLTLAEFEPEEKDEFVRRWCEVVEPPERCEAAARALIADIHSNKRVERLTGNPMLLTTMALVKRRVGRLPQRRVELYGEAVSVLLNWRAELGNPLDAREALPQLRYLAYAMCDRGVQRLSEEEVLSLLGAMRKEFPNLHALQDHTPEGFLHELERRTGLLIQAGFVRHDGIPVPVYEFRHLTLQEFLAAQALVEGQFPGREGTQSLSLADRIAPLAGRTAEVQIASWTEAREIAVVESWRETLRLCTSLCNDTDVDPVLRAILIPLPGEAAGVARARAIQAANCLTDEPNAGEGARLDIVTAMSALSDRHANNFYLLARKSGFDRAADGLAGSRWAAEFQTALVAEFLRRPVETRLAPGWLAGRVGVVATRPNQATEISWLEERTQRLRQGDDPTAVVAALEIAALPSRRPNIVLVPGLISALLHRLDDSAGMAHAAALALCWVGPGSPFPRTVPVWLPGAAEIDRLVAFVGRPTSDPAAVACVATILGAVRTPSAIDPLVGWLTHLSANFVPEVIRALGRIGDKRVIDAILPILGDADAAVRGATVEALGRIGGEGATDAILPLLGDTAAEVRCAAVEALGRIGGEGAIDDILPLLGDAAVRRAAVEALGCIGGERAIDAILPLLGDAAVCAAAVEALAWIGGERAIAAILPLLSDADAAVRGAVADALGWTGGEREIDMILPLLSDAVAAVRFSAVKALGYVGGERAIAAILPLLNDADSNIRLPDPA